MVASSINKSILPIDGIRVLDLGTMTPGKYCTFILGDLGAEVIRVERPTAPSASISDEDLALNRNKRSIALDLRTEEGKQVFYRLAQRADVILESNRPGVTKRMGVDYETVKGLNSNIVYCSLSGFGQDGPYHQLPGFDLNFMAISGLLGLIGGRPPIVPGIYISDVGTGLLATIGILTALLARQRIGRGQFIDIAMLDGVVSWLSTISGVQRLSKEPPPEMPGWVMPVMPCYNVYKAKDGGYLALGAFRPQSWQTLCRTLGRDDLIGEQWAMGEKGEEILSFFQKTFLTKTRDEWCHVLRELDVEVSPVNSPHEVCSDPQVLHRQMVVEDEHPVAGRIKQVGIPIKFSETPAQIRSPAPAIGQDSEAILRELGYSDKEIKGIGHAQMK